MCSLQHIDHTRPKGAQGDQLPHLRPTRIHHDRSFQYIIGKKVYNVGPPKAFQDNSWSQQSLHSREKYYQEKHVSKFSGVPKWEGAQDLPPLSLKRKDNDLQ